MESHLFLVIVESWPDLDFDSESNIVLDIGLERYSQDSDIPIGILNFMSTLLVSSSTPELAISEFRTWWSAIAEGSIFLETLATESARISAARKLDLEKLKPGNWSFRSNFVAYKASSKEAYELAKEIIIESELALH